MRDLLLGIEPKDFDVATDAHPEEVRRLFRNCRLIGRRFHLAHVRFGQEIIEVATFRAPHRDRRGSRGRRGRTPGARRARAHPARQRLRHRSKRTCWRRDFTANALYYNIEDFSIWDYVGGVDDVAQPRPAADRRSRDALPRGPGAHAARGALRGQARLQLHPDSEAPIASLPYLLDSVPPARLFDETIKLLLAGRGMPSVRVLLRLRPARAPVPDVDVRARAEQPSPSVAPAAARRRDTDERVHCRQNRDADLPVRGAAVARDPARSGRRTAGLPSDPQLAMRPATRCSRRQVRRLAIPKRFSLPMREIVALQPRFERRAGRRALRLLEHPRFRAAYDFLLSACRGGRVDPALADWWTRIQELPADDRDRRGRAASPPTRCRRRRAGAVRGAADGPRPERDRSVSTERWMPAYVGLGSNLDRAARAVVRAFEALAQFTRYTPVLRSRLYRTQPFGPVAQPDFVNAAAGLLTRLPARTCLLRCRRPKRELGRARRRCAGARAHRSRSAGLRRRARLEEPAHAAAPRDRRARLRAVSARGHRPRPRCPGWAWSATCWRRSTRRRSRCCSHEPTPVREHNRCAGPQHRYIVVEGPIGVGKTSLARRLAESFGSELVLEQASTTRSSSASIATRARRRSRRSSTSCSSARASSRICVSRICSSASRVADYLLEKDRLFARLTLDEEEFALYEQVYARLALDAPQPDLVVYLQAPVDVLLDAHRAARHRLRAGHRAALSRAADEAYARFFHRVRGGAAADRQRGGDRPGRQRRRLPGSPRRVQRHRNGRHYFNPLKSLF